MHAKLQTGVFVLFGSKRIVLTSVHLSGSGRVFDFWCVCGDITNVGPNLLLTVSLSAQSARKLTIVARPE